MNDILAQQEHLMTFWDVLRAYFAGQDELLGALAFATNHTTLSLMLVFLAGFSDALGNSVILLANRVRPFRFLLSLLATAFIFIFSYLGWALSLMLIGSQFFNLNVDRSFFFAVVAMSYLPLLFSALGFLPFLGHPIRLLLYGISNIYLIRILTAATTLTITDAFLCALGGFLFLEFIQATIGRPIIHVGDWVVSTAAGRKLERNIETALRFYGERR